MTAVVHLLLAWCAASVLVCIVWAALCGPADLCDDDLYPDDDGWSR